MSISYTVSHKKGSGMKVFSAETSSLFLFQLKTFRQARFWSDCHQMDTCYYSSEEDEWDELNQHLLSSENGLSQPLIPSDDGPNRPLTSIHKRRIPDKRYKESDHYVDISNNRISSIVWAAMKMSCIFHQRKLVVERQCFRCQIQHTSQSVQVSTNITKTISHVGHKEIWEQFFDSFWGIHGHIWSEKKSFEILPSISLCLL